MIRFVQGDLLAAESEALVNAVNTVGIMGKGVALAFKNKFPVNYALYRDACARREVKVGQMFVTEQAQSTHPKWIINFPTKIHWRYKSKIEWITSGLESMKQIISEKSIRSIAIPALGCGSGGLNWQDIRPLIIHAMEPYHDVETLIFEPMEKSEN